MLQRLLYQACVKSVLYSLFNLFSLELIYSIGNLTFSLSNLPYCYPYDYQCLYILTALFCLIKHFLLY